MKLQDGLIDLHGWMLQWRNAVKTDASRLVSEEPLKDNESHRQEMWPFQHMKPTMHQTTLHGNKPRLGEILSLPRGPTNKKQKEHMRQELKMQMFQFIFISIVCHYEVEINGFKTTGNTEKKCESSDAGCAKTCTRAHSRVIVSIASPCFPRGIIFTCMLQFCMNRVVSCFRP